MSPEVRAKLDAEAADTARRKMRRDLKRHAAKLERGRLNQLAKLKAARKRRHYDTCYKHECRWCDYYGLPPKDRGPHPHPGSKRLRRMGPLASRLRWPNGDPFGDL